MFSGVGLCGSGQTDRGEKYHHSTCLASTDYTQHPIFQDGRSTWSRPQRCQLAGGGTLLETQLRTSVKDLS
jgi:hypothetical protein